MSEETPLTKEEQKEQLREGLQDTELLRADTNYRSRQLQKRLYFVVHALGITAMVCGLVAAFLFYINNYPYTTYSSDWEMTMGNLQGSQLTSFDGGVVVVGSDSVTYVKENAIQWTSTMNMTHPLVVIQDSYFAVYDRGGFAIMVCNAGGVTGKVSLSRELLGVDISSAGVIAAVTESSDAAYISYFDRYGSKLSVEVRTVLNISGYPMHISISPDGQKLAVVYYRISGGFGESRLVLYDFENGDSDKSYVTVTYEDYANDENVLVDCHFFDNERFAVVGDKGFSVVHYKSTTEYSRINVAFQEELRSLFWTDNSLGVVQTTEQGMYCRIFDWDGTRLHNSRVSGEYSTIITGNNLMGFVNGANLKIENLSGAHRYEGTPTETLVSAAFVGDRQLILNTGSELKKITLR